jgi:hypothetical protein
VTPGEISDREHETGFQEGIDLGVVMGVIKTAVMLVTKGIMSMDEAAEFADVPKEILALWLSSGSDVLSRLYERGYGVTTILGEPDCTRPIQQPKGQPYRLARLAFVG